MKVHQSKPKNFIPSHRLLKLCPRNLQPAGIPRQGARGDKRGVNSIRNAVLSFEVVHDVSEHNTARLDPLLFRHFIVALAFACGRKLDLGDAYGERFSRDAHTKAEDVGDGFLECDARLVLVLSGRPRQYRSGTGTTALPRVGGAGKKPAARARAPEQPRQPSQHRVPVKHSRASPRGRAPPG